MLCPKCGNDNFAHTSICFYCGGKLPGDNDRVMNKEKSYGWRPEYIDVYLPGDEGMIRISYLKPPFIDGKKILLLQQGADGRLRPIRDISDPKVRGIIRNIKGAVNLIP